MRIVHIDKAYHCPHRGTWGNIWVCWYHKQEFPNVGCDWDTIPNWCPLEEVKDESEG